MTTFRHFYKNSKRQAYLELQEIALLEQSATNLRDRLLIRLSFHLGCRVSEALAPSVDDINFTESTIAIIHLKSRLKLSRIQCGSGLGRSHMYYPKYGGKVENAQAKQQECHRQHMRPRSPESCLPTIFKVI